MKTLLKKALLILSVILMTALFADPLLAQEEDSNSVVGSWVDSIYQLINQNSHTDQEGVAHVDPDILDQLTQKVIDSTIILDNKEKEAARSYTNPENGFKAIIEDDAELIRDVTALLDTMIPITKHCNVMFKSIDHNNTTTMLYAYDYLHKTFGGESATIFIIDMDNRNIYIRSDGAIIDRMTNTKSTVITDNAYTYASKKDYDGCAGTVFTQMYDVLEGYAIAEPMHIIGIALISLLLAMIICFIIINKFSVKKEAKRDELMLGTDTSISVSNISSRYVRTKKEKIESSGGGGGFSSGGGGGFSGGGGGGGFSGTGGGHSF